MCEIIVIYYSFHILGIYSWYWVTLTNTSMSALEHHQYWCIPRILRQSKVQIDAKKTKCCVVSNT